jgi:RNA polymerase sigma-70 factor, ECF subfamily
MMAVSKAAPRGSRPEAKERLLVEAAQKDPARFADLYEENFERVYAFIARRVRDRAAAEDLTADVFHKALANLPRFDWRGVPFAAWLLRIASNVVADRWRRSAREVVEDPPEESAQTISPASEPEEIERLARLFRMVENLPADQRRVIGMRFAEGMTIREIAQELGRSEGAVKQLQFRGLETLRAQLGGKHG